MDTQRLRALTYLAPGIPLAFFQAVTDHLAAELGLEIQLASESRSSGPMHGQEDPFGDGRADVGFLCSPSYLYLRSRARPTVELVPAGFVFRDARNAGQPVYFAEVVVRADHPARNFGDLAGGVWGFNDECSLSGYFSALQRLAELGLGDFFGERVQTGSHHASVDAILASEIDGAAIDSIVLATLRRERPDLNGRLRVLDSWGPFPIQPVVVRSGLEPDLTRRISEALLGLHESSAIEACLRALDLERCVPIDDEAYSEERRALCNLGQIPA